MVKATVASALLGLLAWASVAQAELYAYANKQGDYVITKTLPKDINEYAILTDQGEFVRLVQENDIRAPISHWRPWFIPKEPHPLDGPTVDIAEQEPVVEIEEIDQRQLER